MLPKRAAASKKKEFVWTDDEADLLLTVTHEYKIKHLVEGTYWESVSQALSRIVLAFVDDVSVAS